MIRKPEEMNFFRKKKETQPSVTVSNTSVQEALEHDFVVLSPVSHIQANDVTSPTGR